MKVSIEPSAIRFGDLIRWESSTSDTAREFRHTDPNSRHTAPGNYYLLNRPEPAFELPTEPTLGWLKWYAGEESSGLGIYRRVFGIFHLMPNGDVTDYAMAGSWPAKDIVSFVPAIAVPVEAWERFRSWCQSPGSTLGTVNKAARILMDVVDEANEATS